MLQILDENTSILLILKLIIDRFMKTLTYFGWQLAFRDTLLKLIKLKYSTQVPCRASNKQALYNNFITTYEVQLFAFTYQTFLTWFGPPIRPSVERCGQISSSKANTYAEERRRHSYIIHLNKFQKKSGIPQKFQGVQPFLYYISVKC